MVGREVVRVTVKDAPDGRHAAIVSRSPVPSSPTSLRLRWPGVDAGVAKLRLDPGIRDVAKTQEVVRGGQGQDPIRIGVNLGSLADLRRPGFRQPPWSSRPCATEILEGGHRDTRSHQAHDVMMTVYAYRLMDAIGTRPIHPRHH